jgi:C4-dicarboxylate-specific signal transduction histidine kinase
LIVNAIEALSGVSEGARELLIGSGEAESGGVLVAVRDSGPGVARPMLEHLIDPFHTTKPGGQPANRSV